MVDSLPAAGSPISGSKMACAEQSASRMKAMLGHFQPQASFGACEPMVTFVAFDSKLLGQVMLLESRCRSSRFLQDCPAQFRVGELIL